MPFGMSIAGCGVGMPELHLSAPVVRNGGEGDALCLLVLLAASYLLLQASAAYAPHSSRILSERGLRNVISGITRCTSEMAPRRAFALLLSAACASSGAAAAIDQGGAAAVRARAAAARAGARSLGPSRARSSCRRSRARTASRSTSCRDCSRTAFCCWGRKPCHESKTAENDRLICVNHNGGAFPSVRGLTG